MKFYPFIELDYFTRKNEGGFSRLLSFLDQPSEETFALIPQGVKNSDDVDPGLWGGVHHWCFAAAHRQEVIYLVLSLCFEIAFNKIKVRWYEYMGEPTKKSDFNQQCLFILGFCRNQVYSDPDWQEYREAYEKSYAEFMVRIENSLDGYSFDGIKLEEPQPVIDDQEVGYKLNCRMNQQNELVGRMRDILSEHGFINSSLNDLLPLFIGESVRNRIVWMGTNGELKFLINALVTRRCLDVHINDWERAASFFRGPNGPFIRRQLADNYTEPTPARKDQLNQVLIALRASGVGNGPEEPLP